MPYELSRRNFKTAQRYLERETSTLLSNLSATTKSSSKSPSTQDTTLESLDSMITKMNGLKRKLEGLHAEELEIHRHSKARLGHLEDLFEVKSLVDVKYDEWSRIRLNRLLVDYLLREGYSGAAAHLAREKGIEELVDVDAFVACHKIERSLREGKRTNEALNWCKENGQGLKKGGSNLEFQLRLQQYIEMVRQGHEAGSENPMGAGQGGGEQKLIEARAHAKKWLSGSGDFELLGRAAGLLAYRPWNNVEPYAVCLFHTHAFLMLQVHGWVIHRSILLTLPSPSTLQTAGPTSPTSSSQLTTHSTPSPHAPSSTSPYRPVSPLSKPHPATPHLHPPPPTPHPRPQPFAQYVRLSSMPWRETCRMRTIRRVSWRMIRWCCRMEGYMGGRG